MWFECVVLWFVVALCKAVYKTMSEQKLVRDDSLLTIMQREEADVLLPCELQVRHIQLKYIQTNNLK